MSDIKPGAICRMTFPWPTSGNTRSAFTIVLFKNQDRITDIDVDIRENPLNYYIASFTNNGADGDTFTLIISEGSLGEVYAMETWRVRSQSVEQDIKLIRSGIEGEGGFFKGAK